MGFRPRYLGTLALGFALYTLAGFAIDLYLNLPLEAGEASGAKLWIIEIIGYATITASLWLRPPEFAQRSGVWYFWLLYWAPLIFTIWIIY